MKQQTKQHCSKRSFQVGDKVFFQLQPYKQNSLKQKGYQKSSTKIIWALSITLVYRSSRLETSPINYLKNSTQSSMYIS